MSLNYYNEIPKIMRVFVIYLTFVIKTWRRRRVHKHIAIWCSHTADSHAVHYNTQVHVTWRPVSCSLRFERSNFLHLQRQKESFTWTTWPWRKRHYSTSKRWEPLTQRHGVTCHTTCILSNISVRMLNLSRILHSIQYTVYSTQYTV